MNITIKTANLKDLDRVTYIESVCFPQAEAATKESMEDRLSNYSEGFYIAIKDGDIIGFVNGALSNDDHIKDEFFESMKNHEPNGKNFIIFGLDVLPEYQHHGIARQLMNNLINECRSKGLNKILLTCKDHLIDYYGSFGYKNEGVSDSVHGGAKWYDMYLEL